MEKDVNVYQNFLSRKIQSPTSKRDKKVQNSLELISPREEPFAESLSKRKMNIPLNDTKEVFKKKISSFNENFF